MLKNIYRIVFICLILLMSLTAGGAMAEDYIKNIETGEARIESGHNEFSPPAYLCVEFKNNGDKNIANLTFEISYYDQGGYLLKKSVIKNALIEAIPKREARKYRVRLKGDFVNTAHEQYPYEQHDKVSEFDIKIIKVKFGKK